MTKEKVAGPWEFFAAAFVDISIALVDEVSQFRMLEARPATLEAGQGHS